MRIRVIALLCLAALGCGADGATDDLAAPADLAVDLAAPAVDAAVPADLTAGPDLADPRVACAAAGGICRRLEYQAWMYDCDRTLDPTTGGSDTSFYCSQMTPGSTELCCHPRPCVQAGGYCAFDCYADGGMRDGGGCQSDWGCCL